MIKSPQIIQSAIERLDEKFADDSVALISADCFFIHHTEIPQDLEEADKIDFLELSLEGASPFPIDQLFWGTLIDKDSSKALIYATPKSRVQQIDPKLEESAFHLFPAFLPLAFKENEEKFKLVYYSSCLSILVYEENSSLPTSIISRKFSGNSNDVHALRDFSEKIAKPANLPVNEIHTAPLWIKTDSITPSQNGHLSFEFERVQEEQSSIENNELRLSHSEKWNADLRDRSFAKKEAKERRQGRLLWKSMIYLGGVLIALILLQLTLFVFYGITNFQQTKISDLDPMVTRITNKIQLAERLTQSTEQDVKPFVMLESINALRPDSIYFRKVGARNFNRLEIDGDSNDGISAVNAYAEAIKELEFIREIQNNPETKNNRTQFEYLIEFSEIPDISVDIPDENPEEDEEETEEAS